MLNSDEFLLQVEKSGTSPHHIAKHTREIRNKLEINFNISLPTKTEQS